MDRARQLGRLGGAGQSSQRDAGTRRQPSQPTPDEIPAARVQVIRSFQVRIPPGVTEGRQIRVPGHGETGHDGAPAGDLYLRVRHVAHPDFTTRESDLFRELNIAPWEAVLGLILIILPGLFLLGKI